MSDAINGGGGGSDPFAMFQQILDPLGLFKGLGGGIDKMLKQGSDVKDLSEFGKSLLNNDVAQHAQSQNGPSAGTDPTTTTYAPPPNQDRAGQGWASEPEAQRGSAPNPVRQGPGEATKGGINAAINASLAQNANSTKPENSMVVQNAAEMQAQRQKHEAEMRYQQKLKDEIAAMETEAGHMEQILADFQAFDSQGWDKGAFCDSKFDRLNLQNVAKDPNYPEAARKAAQYLLDTPDVLRKLQAASGGGSGMVVSAAIQAHFTTLTVDVAQKKSELARAQSGGSPNGAGGTSPTGPGQNNGAPPSGTDFNPGHQNVVQQKPTPESTLDGRLAQMGQSLDDKRDELIRLYNKPESELTEADKRRIKVLPLEIEKASQRYSEMHNLVANLMKSFHDMSMNSIRHIG